MVVLIAVLAVAGYGHLCTPGQMPYSPYSDVMTAHLTNKTVLYDSWHSGHGIPFWRTDQFSGYPALTDPQCLYTYPLNFLFYVLSPAAAVGGTLWLHFLAAGLGFYILGSVLELKVAARLFMAVAGLFNFKLIMAAYAGWLAVIPSIVLLPWLFAVVLYFFQRPSLGRGLLVGLVGGLCLHTGMVQLIYYSAWFLIAYAVMQFVTAQKAKNWVQVRRMGLWLMCGVILAVGMSAYLWIPLLAESRFLSRSEASYNFFLGNHSLKIQHLFTVLYPELLGTPINKTYPGSELWEDVAYFGLLPLTLAIAGITLAWNRRITKYFVVSSAVCIFLSFNTPVLRVLYEILPGFSLFRNPGRFTFLFTFFGITLAGIGLDSLLPLAAKWRPSPTGPRVAVVVLIALVTAEGIHYSRRYLTMTPISQVLPETDYQRLLSKDRSLFRVAPAFRSVNYGWSGPMKLQFVTGYDSYNLKPYQDLFDLLLEETRQAEQSRVWTDFAELKRLDVLNVLNTKYIISAVPLEIPDSIFEKTARFKDQPAFRFYQGMTTTDIYIYRNRHVLPRAFLVPRLTRAATREQAADQVRDSDLNTTAVVESQDKLVREGSLSVEGDVDIKAFRGGHLELATRTKGDRFVVISEVWHPGWQARLDGKTIPVYRTDLAIMGVWIPGGEHRLVMEFRPVFWKSALGVSVATGIAFVILAGVWLVFRRKKDASVASS